MFKPQDIICFCEEISYQTIEDAVLNGATTVEEITHQTNAGIACGTCIEQLEEILTLLQK